ncbi:MAG TPA: DUF1428 family protein [Acidobacteriota bacterium]|nr:DUF1428 family protein [Acidobacteriota bacterium]
MVYIDGYVLAVPTKRIDDYRKLAATVGRVWMDHGALSYVEGIGDDLNVRKIGLTTFPTLARAKRNEVVIFSYITFKSRAQRDAINKKVLMDPRLKQIDRSDSPFDMKRMAYGGFESIVDL